MLQMYMNLICFVLSLTGINADINVFSWSYKLGQLSIAQTCPLQQTNLKMVACFLLGCQKHGPKIKQNLGAHAGF